MEGPRSARAPPPALCGSSAPHQRRGGAASSPPAGDAITRHRRPGAHAPVDEDSAPYSVEDSGADDGAPSFVSQPDEPALPFPRVDIIHANPDIADYVDASPLTAPKPLMVMSEIWAGSTPTTGLRRPTSTLCRTSGRTSTTHPMVP